MKNGIFVVKVLVLITVMCFSLWAQNPPRLQAIHNAADPGLNLLDVTITILGTPVVQLDSISFRSATPMINGISGLPLVVEVSKTSTGAVVLTFPITLADDHTYVGLLNGVENPSQFAPNPDGLDISLDIALTDTAREISTVPGEVQFLVSHGVTDAPTIDISVQGGAQLVNDLSYGNLSGYVSVAPAMYVLDITDQSNNSIASFDVDLSAYADSAIVIFASGFLDPSMNQNGDELGLFAAFPDSTVIEFPKSVTAIEPDNQISSGYNLAQNYPNPFNPVTKIEFSIERSEHVTISIYNTRGQLVQTIANRHYDPGIYKVNWDAGNFPSGVYYYQFKTEQFLNVKKMMLLK